MVNVFLVIYGDVKAMLTNGILLHICLHKKYSVQLFTQLITFFDIFMKYDMNNRFFCGYFYVLNCNTVTLLHLPLFIFQCVSEGAGIEPKTVAVAVRRSNDSARSHPRLG